MSDFGQSDPEFLRALAQNDYMIDGRILPEGKRLLGIADALDNLLKSLQEMDAALAVRMHRK